ncbi:hypothetical protein EVAR_23131_1 [Eumeta japonica]|uniref:Reverse transcriptase domain-containing protein n=1 Tax=Eumeta variegata TaxID=151549 RepID=A0A4C1VC61_EUMVA|nr:hypothetical protein EVAR_23131_1 [Eumeta japonica]
MGELSVKSLLYTDDQIILAPPACEVQTIVLKLNKFVKERGMKVNVSKTKVVVLERNESKTECDIFIVSVLTMAWVARAQAGSFNNAHKSTADRPPRVNFFNFPALRFDALRTGHIFNGSMTNFPSPGEIMLHELQLRHFVVEAKLAINRVASSRSPRSPAACDRRIMKEQPIRIEFLEAVAPSRYLPIFLRGKHIHNDE